MQIEIDWSSIPHKKENNSHSEAILFDQYERLSRNCKVLYDALKRGERLTGAIVVTQYGMLEYRRRFADLRAAGIEIKERLLPGGVKEWWVEK